MKVLLENVSVKFPAWNMDNISFEIPSGSFTSIVGPSGSGKTTILRCICGLQEMVSGKIFFSEKDVTQIPPEKRNAGVVFQGDSLFSHLNVFENVAFGLEMKKSEKISQKVVAALKTVNLEGFEKRNVETLSGGERKRVAIARAIASEPDILLLDEPLNGLDAALKEKMKFFLNELREKTSLTMVLVTHDIDEAFFLSDRIIVMNSGKIEQIGSPIEIFSTPKSDFVREFVKDYILVEGAEKTRNGKKFVEAKFSLRAKGKGKHFISLKKTNYRF